jgi:putative ubiquitin-RnfH superfamily antitoxin RatB of RatAB toxin-antitoxin module
MTEAISPKKIFVEVVLAMPDRQELVALKITAGSTVAEAISQSKIVEQFEDFELDLGKVGIFGKKTSPDQVLREGDRVELYRPLLADPKEVRRQRAKQQSKF